MINSKLRFSIVCTNYNKEKYIQECICSVLNQNSLNYEFIIVDDCSTDKSPDIINDYAQRSDKITYLKNEKNMGMAYGYNKALAVASGEIVSLIDSDDLWYSNKLQIVDDFFKSNPSCVLHEHPLDVYHYEEKTDHQFREYYIVGDCLKYAQETNKIPLFSVTSGLSFRMSVVKQVLPIPLSFAKAGEAFLTRTAMCYGKGGLTSESLGGYRKHDSNIFFGNKDRNVQEFITNTLIPELNCFYKKNGINLKFKRNNRKHSLKKIIRKIFSLSHKN